MVKLRIIYLYLVLLLPLITQAQTKNSPEELRILLSASKPDKHRVDLLLELGQYYLYKPEEKKSDLDSAMLLAKQAADLSRALQYKNGINESIFVIGNIYIEQKNIAAATALLPSVHDTIRIRLLIAVGSYYVFDTREKKPDVDSAFIYLEQGRKESEAIGQVRFRNQILQILGIHYIKRNELQKGKAFFTQNINYYNKIGDKAKEAVEWNTMGGELISTNRNYDEVIHCYEKAAQLFKEVDDQQAHIEALQQIAMAHWNQGNLDISEKQLLEVLEKYKAIGYTKLYPTYTQLTEVSTLKGNLNRALSYAVDALKNIETTDDPIHFSLLSYRVGKIHWHLGNIEKSLEWYRKSYQITNTNFPNFRFSACALVVDCLVKLGRAEEGLALLQKTIKGGPPTETREKCSYFESMGDCYAALAQYDKAEKHYLEMMKIEPELGEYHPFTVPYHFSIGEFYVNRHHYQKAAPYLKKLLTTPSGWITSAKIRDVHFLLFKVDSAAGNYLSAIQHFQMHKSISDSLFTVTKSQQIEELQIQYETAQKEKDIQLLLNESQLQQGKLLQANLTKNITFGGIALLLIIIGLLYSRFRMKQRVNKQLEIQQIEINQTNRSLQNLLKEKEWLLREIHHRVKNNLQIVMSLLNTQSIYLESGAALNAIRDSQHRIRSISLIHQKLYQSQNIARIDMLNYIQELVEYLQDSFDTGYRIHFEIDIEKIELDVTQAVPVGLILNEAISNAIKYAFPNGSSGEIGIALQQTDKDQIQLTVSDNGIGLPVDFDIDKCNSLGMSLMKGLCKQLNGHFEIKSDYGVAIHITFTEENIEKLDTKVPKAAVTM